MSIKEAVLAHSPACRSPLNLDVLMTWAIVEALAEAKNNRSKAARLLGINRSTLLRHMAKKLVNFDTEVAILQVSARPAPRDPVSPKWPEHPALCLCIDCR